MFRICSFLFFLLTVFSSFAQITTEPELPVKSKPVKIIFDSSKDSRLGYFNGDLYAHTGVIIEGKNDWQYVIEPWGNNTTQPKLTNKGNGIYELEIEPDINTFYSVPASEKVVKMAFVFRSSDANQQTNDLFVNVYDEGLIVEITSPAGNSILEKDVQYSITARSSVDADLKLYFNESVLSQTAGKETSTSYNFSESGNFWLIAEATANDTTVFDSMQVFVRDDVVIETKPQEYRKGINYPADTSAALVLWAPLKEHVFVLGDFNNWELSNNFQMKKDGEFFWLEIPNLEKGKEYIFQYLIDGEIKIADPYTEKIVDPWNDRYIGEDVYPNLISYPDGKTEGIASVLQTGQEDYNWEVTDFQLPEKEKMVIYELLIRDFTNEGTYKAVREKLDYLEDLNINVLELMPVNEFENNSSWGYNPSFYFAPDKYYGPKNELKKLIDECHKRGIAVVIDMVLNHSYGASPFVQMYMDNWTVTADNPWYNISSPNPVFSWGYDFNHEASAVEELVDSVNSFWLKEYKVDGFRFDFTKGFTNTPGDGSVFDVARISNLKRMALEIWKRKPEALVILEHFAPNSEEKILADFGMLIWGNMNESYTEAAMGYNESNKSNLENGLYLHRNWNEPNLVTYMESHDEERIVYESLNSGNSQGNYNTRDLSTALDRMELNAVFHITLPGPKMIWQFGELGYDFSINYNDRTGEKPIRWDYLNNADRTDLFKVVSKLNHLKQNEEVFTSENFEYDLSGETKWYKFSNEENKVMVAGNFGVEEKEISVTFPETGKYYGFFSEDSIVVNSSQQTITLAPGEYRLYSTNKMEQARVATNNKNNEIDEMAVSVFPNPVSGVLNISSMKGISDIYIYSMNGKLKTQINSVSQNIHQLNVSDFLPGIYLLKMIQNNKIITKKILIK